MKVPFSYQKTEFDCGPTSLTNALSFLFDREEIPPEMIRRIMAYCLDGGQTAAIVMGDQLINRPVYGQQRKISDIIYFATAMPEGG